MNALPAGRSGDHLHRPGAVVTPSADPDTPHSAAPGGEQRCMPAKQSFVRQLLRVVLGRVEHHLDHTINVSIGWQECAYVEAQVPGNGRTHLLAIEDLAFDLARL